MAQLKRALCRCERFLEAPHLAQSSGAAAPGVRIMRRERRRRCEGSERLRELACAKQELAVVDMGDDQRGVELERAPIETHCRLRLAAFAQHVSAHAQGGGEIGLEAQRLVHVLDRFVAPSLAPQHDSGGVERVRPGLGVIRGRADACVGGVRHWRRAEACSPA